jgi:hypothetical protein
MWQIELLTLRQSLEDRAPFPREKARIVMVCYQPSFGRKQRP